MSLRLFVGLGNPGPNYAASRHNAGFMAVDAIAAQYGISTWTHKFQGVFADGRAQGQRFMLIKPLSYMNNSGESLSALLNFYKFSSEAITVFHDELDLPLGRIKMKKGGGAAGHNGLKSIDQHIGPDYWRVRMGIGHPGAREEVSGYVLTPFAKAEQPEVKKMLTTLTDMFPFMLEGDMKDLNNRLPPDLQLALNAAKNGDE